MQIIYINEVFMILSYLTLWPLMQVTIGILTNKIPDKYFHSRHFLYKSRRFEKEGKIYKKVFLIHKWKHIIPDGAKAFDNGFQKKHIKELNADYVNAFIAETKRAELMHWLSIFPFFIFGFWSPTFVIWIMLAYALLFNIPSIMIQRYIRPRMQKLSVWIENKSNINKKEL